MELFIPNTTPLEQLERYQKKLLKQVLLLPPNTPDPAVYLLSGTLPVEAQLHIRALSFFNNICNQEEKSIEKLSARQQLRIKTINSNSWFIEIKKMVSIFSFGGILPISIDDEHLTFNSGYIFPGR
jgi:hypothetical protein